MESDDSNIIDSGLILSSKLVRGPMAMHKMNICFKVQYVFYTHKSLEKKMS